MAGFLKRFLGGGSQEKDKVNIHGKHPKNDIFEGVVSVSIEVSGNPMDRVNSTASYRGELTLEISQDPESGDLYIADISYNRDNFKASEMALIDIECRCNTLKDKPLFWLTSYFNVDAKFYTRFTTEQMREDLDREFSSLVGEKLEYVIRNGEVLEEAFDYDFYKLREDTIDQTITNYGNVYSEWIEKTKYFSTGEGFGTNIHYKYLLVTREDGKPLLYTDFDCKFERMPYCGEDHEDLMRGLVRSITYEHGL